MIEWECEATVLALRPFGEGHAIVTVLSAEQGVASGLVQGGAGRRAAPVLQPGNRVAVRWRARLADQLGRMNVEPLKDRASRLFHDRLGLAGLTAVCAVTAGALPEREPAPGVDAGLEVLLDVLERPEIWPAVFVRYELGLLEALGFGLDLSRCAVTGSRDDLTHVSPRSGRAVSREAAEPYKDRLLVLPPFLLASQMPGPDPAEVVQGLDLTAYFLARHGFEARNVPLPEARQRLRDRFAALQEDGAPEDGDPEPGLLR